MLRSRQSLLLLLLALPCAPALAALTIFATVPEWAALAHELGGEKVAIYSATTALQDPHHVEAKPSLIARARTAQLIVATGAELESGWLPLVLQQSGNASVQPGRRGYFEAARYVALRDKPVRLDRADGDVHAQGDPHIQTDPRNVLLVAGPLAAKLKELDPANGAHYESRYAAFRERFEKAIVEWQRRAAPLRGVGIVQQHKAFSYLIAWLELRDVATLEPKPGIEPTTTHLTSVLAALQREPAKMVVRAAFQSDRPSQWIAERARIAVVLLPFTPGGTPNTQDLFAYYDDTVARLLKAAQ